jgi:hypothetical protein
MNYRNVDSHILTAPNGGLASAIVPMIFAEGA